MEQRIVDEEAPLLGGTKNNKRIDVPVQSNNRAWKIALVAVGALGLIATTASVGGNFTVTNLVGESNNIRGAQKSSTVPAPAAPLPTNGAAPVPYEVPPADITDVLVRVSDPKEFDVTVVNHPNGPEAATADGEANTMTSSDLNIGNVLVPVSVVTDLGRLNADMAAEAAEEALKADPNVILPGSPADPNLSVERAKKDTVGTVASGIVKAAEVNEASTEESESEDSASVVEEGEAEVAAVNADVSVPAAPSGGGKHGTKDRFQGTTEEMKELLIVSETDVAVEEVAETADADATEEVAETAVVAEEVTVDAVKSISPASSSYELVDAKVSPDNYPFLVHYRYSDNSCTNMVAAEGYSLDVCFAAKVDGKSYFQKSVAFTTASDTGMFTYYYMDKECTNLAETDKELKENPTTTQYRTDCFVYDDSSPGKAAVVSVPDVRTVQYEAMGFPTESSVIIGDYGNDQCLVPSTFTWQRTDVCYNDSLFKCDGTLGHKTTYPVGTKCSSTGKGEDAPFKIDDCMDTATYGLVSDYNFQMSGCWKLEAPPLVVDVEVEDQAPQVSSSSTVVPSVIATVLAGAVVVLGLIMT